MFGAASVRGLLINKVRSLLK